MADGSTSTELVTLAKADALTVFTTPEKIDPILARIRDEIDGFTPDLSTVTSRKMIASMAYKVAQSKTYLDRVGKELVDEMKEVPKKIDASRKRIRDTLDAWQEEVRRPLTEWEAAEKSRTDRIKADLAKLQAVIDDKQPRPSVAIRDCLGELKADVVTDERFGEYAGAAAELWGQALAALEAALSDAVKREAEAAELARLRADSEARAKAEQEAKAKADAEDRERKAAEAAAAAERARSEQAAKAERDAADKRERDLKAAVEAAERKVVEAAAKVKADAEQAILHETAAKAAREADREHRVSINRAALAAFVDGGIAEDVAKSVITLIAAGSIPSVTINY